MAPGNVVIIGGGTVGTQAAKMALGMGANVTILDINAERLRQLDDLFAGQRIQTLMSNRFHIAEAVKQADLLIGAVLIPGRRAPKLVTEEMVQTMKEGSVIVDVAVDQGDPSKRSTGLPHTVIPSMRNTGWCTMPFPISPVRFPGLPPWL